MNADWAWADACTVASHIPEASCGSSGDTFLCVVCAYHPRNGYLGRLFHNAPVVIALLLDFDAGTMPVYKNQQL